MSASFMNKAAFYDLDGTLLGNPESTQRFKTAWEALAPEARPMLVYNSGRLVDDLHLDFRNTGRIRDLFKRISKT